MATSTKKMMIALTICSLSGIAHAAQNNKGFWNRLAGLCHTKSPKIQPQINMKNQEEDEEKEEESRPFAPIRNAFEVEYSIQASPNSSHRNLHVPRPPALNLNLIDIPENKEALQKHKEEKRKSDWRRDRSITYKDLERRPSPKVGHD